VDEFFICKVATCKERSEKIIYKLNKQHTNYFFFTHQHVVCRLIISLLSNIFQTISTLYQWNSFAFDELLPSYSISQQNK